MTTKTTKTTTKPTPPLQKEFYAYMEPDGEDSFLMTYDTLEAAVESATKGQVVGTYELIETAKYKVEKKIIQL